MNYQKLFNYLSGLGITPLESDMQEIERIVLESQTVIKAKAKAHSKYSNIWISNSEEFPKIEGLIDIEIHIPE